MEVLNFIGGLGLIGLGVIMFGMIIELARWVIENRKEYNRKVRM